MNTYIHTYAASSVRPARTSQVVAPIASQRKGCVKMAFTTNVR